MEDENAGQDGSLATERRETLTKKDQNEERTNCPGAEDNGCRCNNVKEAGQYCGYCTQVVSKGTARYWGENSFQCAKDGSCCFYGYTKKCDSDSWKDWCPR